MGNLFIWISETLFYLMNGVPLVDSLLIVVWVIVGVLIMVLPIIIMVDAGWAIVAATWFLVWLAIVISPGPIQTQMLRECETVESVIATERIKPVAMTVNQCRYKDNYYGDFGDWKIVEKLK